MTIGYRPYLLYLCYFQSWPYCNVISLTCYKKIKYKVKTVNLSYSSDLYCVFTKKIRKYHLCGFLHDHNYRFGTWHVPFSIFGLLQRFWPGVVKGRFQYSASGTNCIETRTVLHSYLPLGTCIWLCTHTHSGILLGTCTRTRTRTRLEETRVLSTKKNILKYVRPL